uniref:Nucleoside diphosphate kinase B n=1 Tax=Nothobranchius pienaari TaxID=704102 RepID=A0A1A8PHH9_9TELE
MQMERKRPYHRVLVEKTLAVIKPDAFHLADEIENVIVRSGFRILQKKRLQMSPEQCHDFYADQTLMFPSLTAFMSSGPIVALMLARDNAIAHWKSLIGPANATKAKETHPECLRAKYGTSELKNALHGSDSCDEAEREIKFMFPNSIAEHVPSRCETEEYMNQYVNPALLKGLTELCKEKPLNPCIWLADWLLKNNPNQPQICDKDTVED